MQDSSSDQHLLSSLLEELDSEARSENDLCARIRTLLEQLDNVRSEQGFSTTALTARIECAHSNSAEMTGRNSCKSLLLARVWTPQAVRVYW